MLTELNRRLTETAEAVQRKNALMQEKQTTEEVLWRLRQDLDDLEDRLQKSAARLQALEGASLQAGWHSLLGDRDEQAAQARQDLQRLKGQVQKTRRAVQEAEARLSELEAQLAQLMGVEDAFENLMLQKEQALLSARHPLSAELQEINRRQQSLHAEKREIGEALQAGLDALDRLKEAIEALESVSGLGVWDILGGGGLVSVFKHSRIRDARDLLEQAQRALNRFERELRDVQSSSDSDLQVGGLELFLDIFADGLLVDAWVQSKVSAALDRARDRHADLIAALNRLNQRYRQLEQEEADLHRRRREILTAPG